MKNIKMVATGGVITSLVVVLLIITQFIPSGRIAVSALCGIIIYIVIRNYSLRLGVLCYAASSILALFVVGDKTITSLYIIVFGLYSVVKYFFDKLNKVPGYILKSVFYAAEAVVLFFLYKAFAGEIPFNSLYLTLISIGGYIVFLVYDVAINQFYSRVMNYLPKNK